MIGILWEREYFDSHDISVNDEIISFGYNSGNLAFVRGVETILRKEDVVRIPWHEADANVSDKVNVLILPAANQLGEHSNLAPLIDSWARIDIPILVFGLGIQSNVGQTPNLSDSTKAWLNILIDNNRKFNLKIIARGLNSRDFINEFAGFDISVAGGCPSQFISPPTHILDGISRRINSLSSVVVNASDPSWLHLQHLERASINEINLHGGCYIVQAPEKLYEISRMPYAFDDQSFADNLREFIGVENLSQWIYSYARAYHDISSWINYVAGFDYSIGTRIHGAMISIAAGLPALLIVSDTRTVELSKMMNIPHSSYHCESNPLLHFKEKIRSHDWMSMVRTWSNNSQIFGEVLSSAKINPSDQFKVWLNY